MRQSPPIRQQVIDQTEIDSDVPGLREAVERKLDIWKSRLIDLSQRNRLLNFRETKGSTLRITHPKASTVFEHLVRNQDHYFIYAEEEPDLFKTLPNSDTGSDSSTASNNILGRRSDEMVGQGSSSRTARVLYTLRLRARTELEERGTNVLFLALGFLKWADTATGSVQNVSPLVLVPVQIELERSKQRYRLGRVAEDVVVNPALGLKLKNDFGLALPDIPEQPEDIDLDAYLRQVSDVIPRSESFQSWGVNDEIQLGLFSFLKFTMYKDLEANKEVAVRHPIIGGLAGFPSVLPQAPSDLVTAENLDELVPPERTFPILDSDSSQQEAIVAALAGASFVLQGPPGTGKSQTIANIIAECLAAGKKVLFVSEKMAALKVVKRSLDGCGIGDFCLELHSHTKSKREVLEDIDNSLHAYEQAVSTGEATFPFSVLKVRRSQLNAFVKALHTPIGRLKITAFQAHGQLARLWATPDVSVRIDKPLEMTDLQLSWIKERLAQLAANSSVLRDYHGHPWKGTSVKNCSLQQRTDIEQNLRLMMANIDRAFLTAGHLVSTVQPAFHALEVELSKTYTPRILSCDLEQLTRLFRNTYRGFGKYLHYHGYRRTLDIIRTCALPGARCKSSAVLDDLSLALLVRGGQSLWRVQPIRNGPQEAVSVYMLKEAAHWVRSCLGWAGDRGIDKEEFECLGPGADELEVVLDALSSGLAALGQLFGQPVMTTGDHSPLVEVRRRIQLLLERLPELQQFLDVTSALDELRQFGLGDLAKAALEPQVDTGALPRIFERQFYRALLDEVTSSDPALDAFRGTMHEQAIEEFRLLDKQLVQSSRSRIVALLTSARQAAIVAAHHTPEESFVKHETQKRRRHKSLRRLVLDAPKLIQGLKPCFLMSPMSLASYLAPGSLTFDVVLFDEASQIAPEDAIGSILRARQVIVVGDSKQLPPTRFFAAVESDEYLEDDYPGDEVILDSILEDAVAAGLIEKRLLWHYRSRDESLIAFSNYFLYGGSLVTFPSSGIYQYPTGIEFVHVPDGVYDRSRTRTNRKEARRVAELVYQHYQQWPGRSLGVVAFSLPQADAIEAAVEEVRQKDSAFDEWCRRQSTEPFFVKNLENVQGDQRDVMLLSVGYGLDDRGQMSMNFGPLNKDGGHRRFNVAVTRAKEQVKLVSSIEPAQIDLTKTKAEGVRLLKEYMEVAIHGVEALGKVASPSESGESESPFEEQVYEALVVKGLRLQKQVGASGYRIDLAVVDAQRPGRFLLGIECDGASYHSFKTARDRDRLRQQVLEGLGWKIHRIWSRDWNENRPREVDRVLTSLGVTSGYKDNGEA